MDDRKDADVKGVVATGVGTAPTPGRSGVRDYMAVEHLWSARHMSRLCGEVETRKQGTNRTDRTHRSYAISAVFSSAAFLEAFINEILQDVADSAPGDLPERCNGISETAAATLRAQWTAPSKSLEGAPVVKKYKEALKAAGKSPFDDNRAPMAPVKKLIILRNELVHYKPKFKAFDERTEMEKLLKGEFPSNKIFVEPFSPWYTIGCLGHGCAEWAHTSATDFVDEWQTRIGIVRDYKDEMREYEMP